MVVRVEAGRQAVSGLREVTGLDREDRETVNVNRRLCILQEQCTGLADGVDVEGPGRGGVWAGSQGCDWSTWVGSSTVTERKLVWNCRRKGAPLGTHCIFHLWDI